MKVPDLMPASSPGLTSTSSTFIPRRSAQRMNMRSSISAQSWESVPPAPALTVTTASPASYSPENRRASSSSASRSSTLRRVSSSSPAMDSSSWAISSRVSRSSRSPSSERQLSSLRWMRECSPDTEAARSWSSQKPGACISCSSASRRSASAAGSKRVREQRELAAEIGGGRHLSVRPVALLVLLTRAARAWVVAAHPLLVAQAYGLHRRGQVGRRLRRVLGRLGHAGRHSVARCGGDRVAAGRGVAAGVVEAAGGRRVRAPAPVGPGLLAVLTVHLDLDVEDVARELVPDVGHQGREHVKALVLVGHEGVDLGESAQVDALAQVVHVVQVLAPALVDDLEQHEALERPHQLAAELVLALVVGLHHVLAQVLDQRRAVHLVGVDVLERIRTGVDLLELGEEPIEVPLLGEVADHVLVGQALDDRADLVAGG